MSGLLIPDDWNEGTDGFCTMTITVPNSPYWRANVKGQIHRLTFPWRWDPETGDADQAATLGQDIFDSMAFDCQPPCVCEPVLMDFNTDTGVWTIEVGDWTLNIQGGQYLRAERTGGASSATFKISQDIGKFYQLGAVFETAIKTAELVDVCNVSLRYTNPQSSQDEVQILAVSNNGMIVYPVNLSDYPEIEDCATIDAVVYEAITAGQSTNYARLLVDYYSYTCP